MGSKVLPNKDYSLIADAFGEPQELYGVKMYPFMVGDYDYILKSTILYCNNAVEEIEMFRKMSLLKYFLFVSDMSKDKEIAKMLRDLLEKVFNQKVEFQYSVTKDSERCSYEEDFTVLAYLNEYITDKERDFYVSQLKFYIHLPESDKTFYESMFKLIKDIILFQNYLPSDNFQVTSRKAYEHLESVRKNIFKKSDSRDIFQDIVLYRLITGDSVEYIKENTTWKMFKATIDRYNKIIDYKTFKPLELSGQIQYKDKKHKTDDWGSSIKTRGYYDNILERAETALSNLQSATK